MAKKRTRRSISVNRAVYATAKRAAERRGTSIAHLVEDALRAAGVDLMTTHAQIAHEQQHATKKPPRLPKASPTKKSLPSPREPKERLTKEPPTSPLPPKAPPPKRLEGPIRRALGDKIADWAGEP